MRHRDARQRLTQKPAHARMLKRNLVTSILLYESVRTTKARAKAIVPVVDRLIAKAKNNPPHTAIRYINRIVTDKNASKKIMEVLQYRYAKRASGLTRTVPVGVRQGDGALLVDVTLVEGEDVPEVKTTATEDLKEVKDAKEKKTKQSPASSKKKATSASKKK